MKKLLTFAAIAAMTLTSASAAFAADHEVLMLNRDSEGRTMQFEPAFLQIAPGDTVTFIVASPSHNSEIIPGMLPEGGEGWKGRINEEISVTLTEEGLYGYKCQPHLGMGMVGLIQVGEAVNELDPAEIEKLPPRARERMYELLAEAEAGGEAAAAE